MHKSKGRISATLSPVEQLIVKLEGISRISGSRGETARSLINWYMKNQWLTADQKKLAKTLIASEGGKKKKAASNKKYQLYAIKSGCLVRIGLSTNVNRDLDLVKKQSGGSGKVHWKYYVGRELKEAEKAERKLLRLCDNHKVARGWFKDSCMEKVKSFSVNLST